MGEATAARVAPKPRAAERGRGAGPRSFKGKEGSSTTERSKSGLKTEKLHAEEQPNRENPDASTDQFIDQARVITADPNPDTSTEVLHIIARGASPRQIDLEIKQAEFMLRKDRKNPQLKQELENLKKGKPKLEKLEAEQEVLAMEMAEHGATPEAKAAGLDLSMAFSKGKIEKLEKILQQKDLDPKEKAQYESDFQAEALKLGELQKKRAEMPDIPDQVEILNSVLSVDGTLNEQARTDPLSFAAENLFAYTQSAKGIGILQEKLMAKGFLKNQEQADAFANEMAAYGKAKDKTMLKYLIAGLFAAYSIGKIAVNKEKSQPQGQFH